VTSDDDGGPSWLVEKNERTEEFFFPWIVCPYCGVEGPMSIAAKTFVRGDTTLDVVMCSCASCDTVLNLGMDDDVPQVEVTWLNEEEAARRGWTKEPDTE